MKKTFALLSLIALSSCTMLSPYGITFTTQDRDVIDPAEDTLDFVLSAPAYAYISAVSCEDGTNRTLAPSFNSQSEPGKVYNLALTALEGVSSGSECNLTVNVFDKTTSSESRDFISLYVLEAPEEVEEAVSEEAPVEEAAVEEVETEEVTVEEAVDETEEVTETEQPTNTEESVDQTEPTTEIQE